MTVASPDQQPDGWGAVAETYEQVLDPFTGLWAEEALRLVPPSGSRILDVATGCGNLAVLAAARGADVVAIDFSRAMLERLRTRLSTEKTSSIRVALMDGQRLALRDRSFDAAYSVFGLMFFPDRVQGLREMWRVLRPGGCAVVSAWVSPERMVLLPLVRRAVQMAVPGCSPPVRRPSWQDLGDPGAFQGELKAAGFGEVTVQPVTRTGAFASPEWLWANIGGASPVLSSLIASLDSDEVAAAGRAFVAELRGRFGERQVTLPGEALLAVGRKTP